MKTQTVTMPEWDERTRKAMLWGGILFILTFLTSIPALPLYADLLDHPEYVLGAGSDTKVTFGALLEIGVVISNIGTAIAFYPILRRFSESVSLAYVANRIFESSMIAVGIMSLLAVLTLRQDIGGADASDAAALVAAASALLAVHDWTFLFGPAFCAGFGNGLLLGYLMYKSRLMPRRMAMIGIVGGPIAFGNAVAVLFGAYEQMSVPSLIFTGPEIVWELCVGFYLTTKAISLGRARRSGLATYGESMDEAVSLPAAGI